MKRVVTLIVVAACFFGATYSANAEVGYDGGFYVSSDDGMFKLTFNSLIQPRLFYQRSKSKPLPDDPSTTTNQLTFSMRRAQLGVTSNVGDNISFGFTIYHSTQDPEATNGQFLRINGATATYTVMPQLGITVGMVGLPLDLGFSSKWLLLAEGPAATSRTDGIQALTVTRPSFGAPDGLGVEFAGDISKFYYKVSVVNGAESNYALNPDRKMSFGAKVGVNILDPIGSSMTDFDYSTKPKLTVNLGSIYQGKRPSGVMTNTDPPQPDGSMIKYIWTSSLGLGFRWKGLAITTEGYYRRMKMDSLPVATANISRWQYTDAGYYGAVGYYIIPKKLEVAAQVSQIFRQGPDNNVNEFGGALNWYVHDNNLKVQFCYDWTQDYDDVWGDDQNNIHNFSMTLMANF